MSGQPTHLPAVAPDQQRHFRTFGFVQMRQVLGQDHFTALLKDYDKAINAGDLRLPLNELGRPAAFVASCMSEASPSVVELATCEATLNFVGTLLGELAVCVNAFAYQRSESTRWHSDNIAGSYRGLKLYLNLDEVGAESGALRVLAGSHQDPMCSALIPKRYEMAEQQFGLSADLMPAAILSSEPGDLSVFDLRVWHAVCGSRSRRRVIELTYYEIPQTPAARAGFVAQMRAHQRQAYMNRTPYYPKFWRGAGGPAHRRGLDVLSVLDLLETSAGADGP